ncbi:hypothetical protein [uncultured Arthrobacter sp.]|uniref:hypothetical protein n=1 Tax=uncultured Arthrobacter sp. TaxID=114050 RepID=UPI0025CDB199|nr:hypothetical protein [uncultured Arthrobacter sp.]
MLTFIRALPQPAKTLYVLIGIAFIVQFASVLIGQQEVSRVNLTIIGGLFAALGVVVALNINGTAQGMADTMKDYKPMGVDYSKSFLATPGYARLFGVGAFLVGSSFALTGIFNPEMMQ